MADLQEIVDDLEAEIRRPISVEDRRWRLLAHSAQPDEADPVRRASILTRETPADVTAWLEGLGLLRAHDFVEIPPNDALGMARRGCLPIRHGDVLLGFLWVIIGERPLSAGERDGLMRGAAEVAANLWARRREADERRRRTQEHLGALLAGEDAAADLAAVLRWPVAGAFAIAVCDGDDGVAERLRRRRAASDFAWSAGERRLTILARDPEPRGGGEGAARGGFAAAVVAAGGGPGGVSAPFARLADAPAALGQAEVAALCARARPELGPVAAWDGLGSWALVAELWTGAGRPAPPPAILALVDHRRGTQLLEALEGLLDAGGDVARAARALHLHRASLYRRLARIEEVTGLDLERGDDRLLLHIGLRLWRLASA